MRCPNCGKLDTFKPWEGRVQRLGVTLEARGERCRACGETLYDVAESKRQERALAKGLAARGVRTGAELKLVRKAAGLRAVDVAALLDVTPETVSRWETGAVEIPRSVAYVVGDLLEHPKLARERLEALARKVG